MLGHADLTRWQDDAEFRADPTAVVVLDRDLVIRAVNPAYEALVGFAAAALVSRHLCDAFPANPAVPDGDEGPASMTTSFEQVMREGRAQNLVLQRYDIPDAGDPTRFLTKLWEPVSVPVWSGEALVGVACRVAELRLPLTVLEVLGPLRQAIREAADSEDPASVRVAAAVSHGLRSYAAALAQVEQLEEALTSRATIEQAKGLLMAEQRCTPDEAFGMLVKLSNDTNVRVADVAGALVYQAQCRSD